MYQEEKPAYIMSQVACALIEALGMLAENQYRLNMEKQIAYDGDSFFKLIDEYHIGHNDIMSFLQG